MKKYLTIPFLLGCMASLSYADITVKPAGVQLVWQDGAESFGGFKTFNSKPGVKVALHLTTDKDTLTGIDQNESKVTVGGIEGNCWFFGSSSSISKDGKALKLEIGAEGAKAIDGKIKTSGEVVVTTASGREIFSTEMIEWKKDAQVQFPKEANLPTFKVKKIGKPDWGDEKWEVTLSTNKKSEQFVSVKFVDENGKEHTAQRGSWSSMSILGIANITVSYKAPETISKAKMVVEVWKDLKKTTVPVNLTLGMSGAE